MRNFITILRKYKTSSILNILGLAVAFASLYIILVQVNYDLTYNKEIKNCERVYQFEVFDTHDNLYTTWISRPLAESLIKGCPSVESFGMGDIGNLSGSDCCIEQNGSIKEISLAGTSVSMQWIDVFGYEVVSGSLKKLEEPKTAAILESTAKKYGLNIGDSFYWGLKPNPEKMNTIVAIFKDFPKKNTDLSNIEVITKVDDNSLNDWSEWSFNYFVKLKSPLGISSFYENVNNKYRELLKQNGVSEEEISKELEKVKVRILPISETYFSTDSRGVGRSGNKATTYTLLAIAILVVVIALINFINFFFALVPIRIRYVNTRKIFGCSATRLRLSFVFEAIGIIIISLFVAWACVDIVRSSSLANYISASLDFKYNIFVLGLTILVALFIALLGSIYPSFYITSFPTAMVIKGSFAATKNGQRLRIALIGLQFIISIGLIISTMLIKLQHSYMMNYDMGFNKEMLLSSYIPNKIVSTVEQREAFSNKLKENPQIKDMAYSDGVLVSPQRMGWGRSFKEQKISLQCMPVSWDFLKFMGIDIVEGRNFTREDEFKENGTFILNKKAGKEYGITLQDKLSGHAEPTEIAGFCEDFNFKPLQYGVEAFSFYVFGKNAWRMPNHLYLRTTKNADIPAVIEYLKNTIMAFSPESRRDKLEVVFFDKELGQQYQSEQKLTILVTLFTVLSIIISLMGVFGLVLFETQYRRREIGLRRVHGSTIMQILALFNAKFVKIIIVCFIISAPLSYLVIDRWLESFAYRTPIYWWVFAIALITVLLITIILVTLRSLKAATDNPIDAIRTEG
ncbi:MAG: FtsX-like permease family protein [Bacteroidales bacterium]